MEHRLCNSDWYALRKLLRRGRATGHELRGVKTRKTKDGEFLRVLRLAGLIRRTSTGRPELLDDQYEITAEGTVAAEYGFYDGTIEYGICVATKGWRPEPTE